MWGAGRKRTLIFVLIAAFAAVVVPSLATLINENGVQNSELVSIPQASLTVDSPIGSPSPGPTPEVSYSSSSLNNQINLPNASNQSQTSGSPTPKPSPSVLPINLQKFVLGIPNIISVDPRAQTLYFPNIQIVGNSPTLVCISSDSGQIDVYQRNFTDTITSNGATIFGDNSNFVLLSGPANEIASAINGSGGLALYSYSRLIANMHVLFQVIAVSEPIINPAFCNFATSENTKQTSVKALGLTLDTRKGTVSLHSTSPKP